MRALGLGLILAASFASAAEMPGGLERFKRSGGAPAGGGQAEATVDLLPEFADGSDRNQADVGSCHAFSSVAVLEAAYFRHFHRAVRFSEADVFLRRTVLDPERFARFVETGETAMREGNDPAGDVEYALRNGIASNVGYDSFVKRFKRWREADKKTLAGINQMREEEGWLERLLYDPREHWAELETRPGNRKLYERMLQGAGEPVVADRAKYKAELAGFSLKKASYEFPKGRVDAAGCRAAGRPQAADIVAELKAGRPVAVSMALDGLPEWGQTKSSAHAYHAFTIVGMHPNQRGEPVFQTRNSWGGVHPDVPLEQTCRIYAIASVLAPGEAAAAR